MAPVKIPYTYAVSTGDQCRESDQYTIHELGIDGFTLMETAGLQAAKFISEIESPESSGIYFCGKGNNGGDALVIARYLGIQFSHTCYIYFPAGRENLSPDAQKNLDLLLKLKQLGLPLHLVSRQELPVADETDYIVDGLLGTGLESNLRSPFDAAVGLINQYQARKYALDIPTGLHTDTGIPMPDAVRADHTLSFGALKAGFYLGQGTSYTGTVVPFNLSFPSQARKHIAMLITPESGQMIPTIKRSAEHKYSDRLLYVVAGSEGLTGAAIMAAASAWKTGVGAVVLISPGGLLEIYEKNLPGIIKTPVGSRSDLCFDSSHLDEVLEIIQSKKGVLLIGPGIGRKEKTLNFVKDLLQQTDGNVVIDADALHTVTEIEKPENANWILTPHPGEAGKLNGTAFKTDFERVTWAAGYSVSRNVSIVSKGHPTFVATPGSDNYMTGYDTRIFARAGFGDVLAGTISGNLAITNDAELSVVRALLSGYMKAIQFIQEHTEPLEPDHLL
jgi:ADP-dependent NAD(P)H-hydrate dehydratase / NAD(P)H-hydrate epimerase